MDSFILHIDSFVVLALESEGNAFAVPGFGISTIISAAFSKA
jgi:hypothetical protein